MDKGSTFMDVMVMPLVDGEPSCALYTKELEATFESLRRRAAKMLTVLNTLAGVSCNVSEVDQWARSAGDEHQRRAWGAVNQ